VRNESPFNVSLVAKAPESLPYFASLSCKSFHATVAPIPELPTEGTVGSVESHTDARAKWSTVLEALTCPVLVTHGTGDRIQPHQGGVEAARLTGGTLVSMEGSGHMPNVRDPIRFNLILREFIERVPT
jgi:pimeloyl-ACP methyl ester carboxylesterase